MVTAARDPVRVMRGSASHSGVSWTPTLWRIPLSSPQSGWKMYWKMSAMATDEVICGRK